MNIKNFLAFLLIIVASAICHEMELQVDPDQKDALPSAIVKAVDQAYELNIKGIECLNKKQLDLALSYFDQALDVLPDYSDAANNRGVVFYKRGNIPEARRIWEELASRDPGYAIASYNLGLIYFNENEYDAASRLFERALKADQKLVEALVRLGYIQIQKGQKDKGLENLKKAYKISPDHQDAWGFLAHGLILCRDTSGAVEILKKRADKAEALKLLGRIEAVRKNYQKATEYFSGAVSRGADPSILVELASAQLDNHKCKDALGTLKSYFSSPVQHSADAYLTAGIASQECGDNSGSAQYFEQGLKEYPSDAIIKYNLGQIYFRQKKFDNAEELWNGLSDSLQDPSLLYLRAINARKKGNLDKSEQLIRKALTMDERGEFYDLLGVIAHQKKDDKKAEENFRKALKIDPNLRSAQLNLALSTNGNNNLSATASELERSLSSCRTDSCADIAFQLSIVYYHLKMVDKAVNVLAALKETDKDERIYRHLAIYYREQHEWDKAIKCLETAAQKLVLEPQTEYELAEDCLLAGYYGKAVDRFTALIPKWGQNPWRLYYQLGYSYFELENFEKAKECFQKSINSKDNTASRGLLAFVYNRQGNVDEARKLWTKNLSDDPNNPVIWINMGLSFEKDGKYSEALEYYKKAQSLKSDDKELQINIGNAYAGMNQYVQAMDAYSQALSSGKKDLAAYNIFLLAQKRKDRQRADKMLKLLEQECPASIFTKRVQAEAKLWDGDTARAVQILETLNEKDAGDWLTLAKINAARNKKDAVMKCLENVPSDAQWDGARKTVLAQLAFQCGNYAEAIKLFKETGDTSLATQYNIAIAAYSSHQYDVALNSATRLLQNASGQDRVDLCRLAGNAAFALKQWNTARQYYLQLSDVDARNSIVQYNLAVAAYNLGQIQDMWRYYQKAKELDNSINNKDIEARYKQVSGGNTDVSIVLDSIDQWYNSAIDLQNSGKDTAAELLYKKVVAKNPAHSQAWNNLGAIYGARGDIDNAENAYQKAIEKRHDIPETYANLVNLYIALEDFSKAKQWIIKGIGHNPDSELLLGLKQRISEEEAKVKQKKPK